MSKLQTAVTPVRFPPRGAVSFDSDLSEPVAAAQYITAAVALLHAITAVIACCWTGGYAKNTLLTFGSLEVFDQESCLLLVPESRGSTWDMIRLVAANNGSLHSCSTANLYANAFCTLSVASTASENTPHTASYVLCTQG